VKHIRGQHSLRLNQTGHMTSSKGLGVTQQDLVRGGDLGWHCLFPNYPVSMLACQHHPPTCTITWP
jgi:hypothetical protein